MNKTVITTITTLIVASSSMLCFADSNLSESNNSDSAKNNIEASSVSTRSQTVFVNANNVRLRSKPSTSSSTLKVLKKGTMVHFTGQVQHSGGYAWYSISSNGTNGWIAGQYLDF